MAANHPIAFPEHDSASSWATVLFLVSLVAFAAVLFFGITRPEARESEASWRRHVVANCSSPGCLSPSQVLTAERARALKAKLRDRVLVLDVGAPGSAPNPRGGLSTDAHVPSMEAGPPSQWNAIAAAPELAFRADFAEKVDDAMRAAHLHHAEPVMLLSPSMEQSMLAALLLQERGYSEVFVVNA